MRDRAADAIRSLRASRRSDQVTKDVTEDVTQDVDAPDEVDEVEVWSSLAEGADRIVASLVPGVADRLVVVLPLEPADYCDDFDTIESVRQFERLLALADCVEVVGADASGSRESAYERAGLRVVEHCDVLLALWDGGISRGRGGTAQIVDTARRLGREVVVIPTERATA